MTYLGLDLSTKTGYAVLRDGKLETYGKIYAKESDQPIPEYAMIERAKSVAAEVVKIVHEWSPSLICIEQTNLGRSRTTQKGLEFIHYAVLDSLSWDFRDKVVYADTSAWRNALKIALTKDQRRHNKAVNARKARGRITPKHLAVAYVNQKYGLKLKLKDNDEADAICLAEYAQIRYPEFDRPISFDFTETFN